MLAALVGLAAGCAIRELPTAPSPMPGLLQEADRRWERRGELGLEAVDEALQRAYQADAQDPEVLWRMVRLSIARGLVDAEPRASEYAYSEGRAIGLQCLDLDRVFPQRRAEYGWVVSVETLDSTYAACGAWMSLAWARWIKAHGGGAAALDLPRVDALIAHTGELGGARLLLPLAWAEGVLAAVRPAWEGQDLQHAETQLLRAARHSPEHAAAIEMDLIELVWLPRGEIARARERLQDLIRRPATSPEAARVQQRAEVLLASVPEAAAAPAR